MEFIRSNMAYFNTNTNTITSVKKKQSRASAGIRSVNQDQDCFGQMGTYGLLGGMILLQVLGREII